MSVRKLRPKQVGPWCSHCAERAVYQGVEFTRFSCLQHLDLLEAEDAKQTEKDRVQNSYQTEAEFQLFGRQR